MIASVLYSSSDAVLDLQDLAPAAVAVVQDVSNRKLKCCLEELLSDSENLSKVAKISHRHQLGFLKLIIQLEDSAEYLRLHVWDQLTKIQEDIHSHCALFQSRIVLGSLMENSFHLSKGDSHALFKYRFDIDAGHAIAIDSGMTGVKFSGSKVLRVGDIYTKRPNELHNVSDAIADTVTVSAWGPRSREALVLKRPGALAEDCVVAIGIPTDELVITIRGILERLHLQ